jgi:hypothetical protein
MNYTVRYIYRILNYSEGTDIQLNTNVQVHIHGMVLNNADTHNLDTRNSLFRDDITIYEIVCLFLEDVLAMALNDPSDLRFYTLLFLEACAFRDLNPGHVI